MRFSASTVAALALIVSTLSNPVFAAVNRGTRLMSDPNQSDEVDGEEGRRLGPITKAPTNAPTKGKGGAKSSKQPSSVPSSVPSRDLSSAPSLFPSTGLEGCGLICSDGYQYFDYVPTKVSFYDALNNPPTPNCFLAPPKEVQDNFVLLKAVLGITSQTWVGGYKDFDKVYNAQTMTKIPGDPVNNWKNFDKSPWFPTAANWNPANLEPNNGNFEPPQPFVGIEDNGKFFDAPITFKAGAIYKCCYDACTSVNFE